MRKLDEDAAETAQSAFVEALAELLDAVYHQVRAGRRHSSRLIEPKSDMK
jgi:predicted house-cleaning noncanonical NTP pyrophosphatase (MazG superfamily)